MGDERESGVRAWWGRKALVQVMDRAGREAKWRV